MNINENILKLKDEVVEIRRTIHKYPERGFEEEVTSGYIISKLEEYGIEEIYPVAKTGVIAYLKGSIGNKTTALRADIDGLPLQEDNDVEYKSQRDGFMHACGHDGHVAMLLGYIKYICVNEIKPKDNLVFIFQPAEEGPGGAEVLLKENVLEKYKIDRIIGMHLFPEFKEGMIASKPGSMMARNGEVVITVKGKASHGAIPQNGIDSIVATANLVLGLQSIISRNIDPMESSILTIGKINGGSAVNIICEKTVLSGTIRAFSDDVYETIVRRIEEIAEGIGKGYNCEVDVEFNHMYKVVINDKELVEALERTVGDDFVESSMFMISEDFSFYQQEIPGIFIFIGTNNVKDGYINPLHNSRFNFNEDVLLNGIQVYANMVEELQ